MKFWVLRRDGDLKVVCVTGDNDPLYGSGSWSIECGPFESVEVAESYL